MDSLCETLFIHCGVSVNEFWSLTWYEIQLYLLRMTEQKEAELFRWETSWDQARQQIAAVMNMAGKVMKKRVDPEKIRPLPMDKKEEAPKKMYSPSEVDEMAKEVETILKKKAKKKNV